MAEARTVSLDDERAPPKRATEPSLVLVLNAADPFDPPACISLKDIDEVSFGRGPERRTAAIGPRRLRVDLADAAVSSTHARLTRAGRDWTIADEQSKNGTLINGRRVASAALGPNDLAELGNSFFLLRRDAAPLQAGPAAMRTLSARLAEQFHLFARVARSELPILLSGETGTGKEMLARAAHEISGRSGPLIALNCGAIPEALVESELFGARKGAYSGAHADRPGKVVAAEHGTCFSTRSPSCPGRRRRRCCASSRTERSRRSARPSRSTSTSGSWPPRTRTSRTPWHWGASATTSMPGCAATRWSCRRCAPAARTSAT